MACNEPFCVYCRQGECSVEASYRSLCPYFDWDKDNDEEDE